MWFVVLLFGLLFVLGSSSPTEATCGGSPVITTDKADYGPTEIVVISGTDFNCGEAISILVTAPDGSTRSGDGTGAAGPDTVVTDEDGAFSISYHLSGTLADGSTYEGQLGIYRTEVRDGVGTVLARTTFSDTTGNFSCAVTTAGGVKCWGVNNAGQLGNGSLVNSATPIDVSGLTSGIIQITLGFAHACALTNTGAVKCWGANSLGTLGNGTFTSSTTPVDVSTLTSGVAEISAGASHTCALMADGGVKCWGINNRSQLGIGPFPTDPVPTPGYVDSLMRGVAQISAGFFQTCALMTDGRVKCWGDQISSPVDVSGLTSDVAQISSGWHHTCAVTSGGGAKCWGANGSGELGNGTFTTSTTPVDVSTLTNGVARISAGQDHTCALMADGGVKCWGANYLAQLGNGTFATAPPYGIPTPVEVSGMSSGVVQISAGPTHTCALSVDGGAQCWGFNRDGQLGNGEFTPYPGVATPVDVSGLTSGVAALWDGEPISMAVPWTVSGFYAPVEMGGALNTVKGGSTLPIKFQVFADTTELTDPSIVVQPLTATQAACSGGPTDTIELTATGGTSLRYDSDGGHFIFNWKTPKMPGYCYTITVSVTNGGSLSANFALR